MKNYMEVQRQFIPMRNLPAAQEKLIESVRPAVCKMAGRLKRRFNLDNDQTKDLIQSGLISVWKAIQSYDPELGAFATYVLTRARWAMRSDVGQILGVVRIPHDAWFKGARHNASRPRGSSKQQEARWAEFLPPVEQDLGERYDLSRLSQRLRQGVQRLPPKMRMVLEMELQQGMTQVEIAEVLKVKRQRVGQIRARAMTLLGGFFLHGKIVPLSVDHMRRAPSIENVVQLLQQQLAQAEQNRALAAAG